MRSETVNQLSFGIDVGGTNIRMAMVSVSGEVMASKMIPGSSGLGPTDLTTLISENLRLMGGAENPIGIGLSLAGTVFDRGEMRADMTNLPRLAAFPFVDIVEEATGLACRVENDATAAMRAEARFGAATGVGNAVCLTLGTGIGSGLLLDGKIRGGAHGNGGEVGQFRMGGGGCKVQVLEDMASPGGLLRRTGLSAESLMAAASAGDHEAAKRMDEVFDLLGLTIANLHLLLDLEVAVLCGGLTGCGQPLTDGVCQAFAKYCPAPYQFGLDIRLSKLGDFFGAIGAASLWFHDAVRIP